MASATVVAEEEATQIEEVKEVASQGEEVLQDAARRKHFHQG